MAGIAPINNNLISLQQTQQSLLTSYNQLSSGKRITTPAVDPSGYAIATALQSQVYSLNAASGNVQNAFNAANVASAGLGQISNIATQLQSLAIQGVNDFLSPTDRAALQAQANQLVQQANTVATTTNFNGVNLLNGQFAGPQAGTPATAAVTNNDALVQGAGTVVTSVTAANANYQNPNGLAQGFGGNATTDSTIQVQVVNNNGQAAAVATIDNNATGQQVTTGPVAAGGVISGFQNVNVQLGNFALADVGQTATIQIAQATPANTQNNALTVQSGANEGNTTAVAIPGTSSGQLQISNIDLSNSLSATNAIGQLNNAITTLGTAQATVGAQQNSLQDQGQNNAVTANNLQTAESNIADLNVPQSVSDTTLKSIQHNIQISLLAQNNINAAAVLGLFKA